MWRCPMGLWRASSGLWREVEFETHGLESKVLSAALHPSLGREDVIWSIASFLLTSLAYTQRFNNRINVCGGGGETVPKNYQIVHLKWLDFYVI